jgi:hypothetical protein
MKGRARMKSGINLFHLHSGFMDSFNEITAGFN